MIITSGLSKPVDVSSSVSNLEIATTIHSSEEPPEDKQIVHELIRGPSQISLKSYYKKGNDKLKNDSQPYSISDEQLKQHWMEKLQMILTEQERILQQEK